MQNLYFLFLCIICLLVNLSNAEEDPLADQIALLHPRLTPKVLKHSNRQRQVTTPPSLVQDLDQWVVHLSLQVDAQQLANQLGLELSRRVPHLDNTFVFQMTEGDERTSETIEELLKDRSEIKWFEREQLQRASKSQQLSDPLFPDQWHLRNTGQGGSIEGLDVNVMATWNLGHLGTRSQIAIVDDGYDYNHPDLRSGYVAADSYDYDDDDPSPLPELVTDNHGTACAGIVGARDEGTCGVGVAYRSMMAGIRLVSTAVTYSTIAAALTHSNQNNMIYSCSWGFPVCDFGGCTLRDLSPTIESALIEGTTRGRGGLGSIYVFSGGNSRENGSNTNYKDLSRSPYTINVASFDNTGQVAFYSEPGAGLLVSTPSSGGTLGITTSDRETGGYESGPCTSSFGGTSASAPMVSGAAGILLEVNRKLTWRDVQYIIASTAFLVDGDDSGWQTNGAGFHVHHDYGFGGLDITNAVMYASNYSSFLDCQSVNLTGTQIVNQPIPDGDPQGLIASFNVSGMETPFTIEHLGIIVRITHPFRGDLRIAVQSPYGTISLLANPRNDPSPDYLDFEFFSVFHWGENPNGEWKLFVADELRGDVGTLDSWSLRFSGPCTRVDSDRPPEGRPPTGTRSFSGIITPSSSSQITYGIMGAIIFWMFAALFV